MTTIPTPRKARGAARERGAAAVLAMMFLVIFASLATAMAIVSQGNLRTADSHLRMNAAMAAADSGMKYTMYLLQDIIRNNPDFRTTEGEIDEDVARVMWQKLQTALIGRLGSGEQIPFQELDSGKSLRIGPVRLSTDARSYFIATLYQHPIEDHSNDVGHPLRGHRYLDDQLRPTPFYDRDPYTAEAPDPLRPWEPDLRVKTGIREPISAARPRLDERYVRLVVQGIDGSVLDTDNDQFADKVAPNAVTRTLSVDLRITKRLDAAVLSKSRLMIGRNVVIDGNIGSAFTDVHLDNGHPIQMESDFRGLSNELDDAIDNLVADLATFDTNGDNRLSLSGEIPSDLHDEMRNLDVDKDGYIDDFDLFFKVFDGGGTEPDGKISSEELQRAGVSQVRADQLVDLIDSFHPNYLESNEGVIDFGDRYAKIRGTAAFRAAVEAWEEGAADGNYHDDFEGPIAPKRGNDATRFGVESMGFVEDEDTPFQRSFGVEKYRDLANGDLSAQAAAQVGKDPDGDGRTAGAGNTPANQPEAVPYKAAYPYDFYDRPVFENMTFTNLFIPKGTNALFKRCTFKGVTYIETYPGNRVDHPTNPNANAYNYSGMQEADGSPKHPDLDTQLGGRLPEGKASTKHLGNNLRFDGCRFEGPVVSGSNSGSRNEQPEAFSHTRNKLTFTSESGPTQFPDVDELYKANVINRDEWDLYRRGRIITPHMSVEMGSFDGGSTDDINLSGVIVAGILDIRGQAKIDGSIITTYEPKAGDGTVMGDTSPQFNTTLGYFGRDKGDLETDRPDDADGWGRIQIRYDPNLPMPDGILMSIRIEKLESTYWEGAR